MKNKIKNLFKNKKLGSLWIISALAGAVILIMLLIVYFVLSKSKRDQAFQTSDLLVDQIENVIHGNERKE